jgi:hypothetical protein
MRPQSLPSVRFASRSRRHRVAARKNRACPVSSAKKPRIDSFTLLPNGASAYAGGHLPLIAST